LEEACIRRYYTCAGKTILGYTQSIVEAERFSKHFRPKVTNQNVDFKNK
jgi:lipoate-protein ligase A